MNFSSPQTVFRLRKSTYPLSLPYNGFSGAERRRGWQLSRFYADNGWLTVPKICSVTGGKRDIKAHNEHYDRPWTAWSVSRRAHYFIHTRYRYPDRWRRFLEEEAMPESWAWALSLKPAAIPRARSAAEHVRSMLMEAPHPDSVVVPVEDFYGMPEGAR